MYYVLVCWFKIHLRLYAIDHIVPSDRSLDLTRQRPASQSVMLLIINILDLIYRDNKYESDIISNVNTCYSNFQVQIPNVYTIESVNRSGLAERRSYIHCKPMRHSKGRLSDPV